MIKIKSLSLKNFKSIGSNTQTIKFAPITLLFGPNGSGKSTIIQALAFLNEVINHRNYDPIKTEIGGDAIDLGGFLNLVHKKDKNKSIEIGVSFDLDGNEINDLFIQLVPSSVNYILDYSTENDYWKDINGYDEWLKKINNIELKFNVSWDDNIGKPFIQQYTVWLNESLFCRINSDGRTVNIQYLDLNHKSINRWFRISLSSKSKVLQDLSIDNAINIIKKTDSDAMPFIKEKVFFDIKWKDFNELDEDDDTQDEYDLKIKQTIINDFLGNLITAPLTIASNFLNEFTYVGPLRDLPQREIKPQRTYEKSRWAKGLAAWDVLYNADESFLEKVNSWIGKDHINTGYKIVAERFVIIPENDFNDLTKLEETKSIKDELNRLKSTLPTKTKLSLSDLNNDIEVMLQDIGVGISQLLPIIVLSCQNNDSENVTQLVSIEQPELHIHPALQVELADLFIESSVNNNKMFLIETHSEHLMLRLLRRIRETTEKKVPDNFKLNKNDVSIVYVEPNIMGTYCTSLHSDEYGEFIERWPKGFFTERISELI